VPIIQIGGLPGLAAALAKKSIYAAAVVPHGVGGAAIGMKLLAEIAEEILHQGRRPRANSCASTEPSQGFRARLRQRGAFHAYPKGGKVIVSRYQGHRSGHARGTMQYATISSRRSRW
jgi:hypothetical protein